MKTEIWRFDTARFSIILTAEEEEHDLDLSWDEDGSVRESIENGTFEVFCAKMSVELDGGEIGTAYLGGCIYKSCEDFIDHRGMNAKGHGSYFSDMVREAITEARKFIADMPAPPVMRAA